MSEIKNVGETWVALKTPKCNSLTPLHFKGLSFENYLEALPLHLRSGCGLQRPFPEPQSETAGFSFDCTQAVYATVYDLSVYPQKLPTKLKFIIHFMDLEIVLLF